MEDPAPVQQSMIVWYVRSLGLVNSVLLPLAAMICCLVALFIVVRGKGSLAGAALVLVVHVPFMIGLYAAFGGLINVFAVIAMSANPVKPSELAEGFSTSVVAPQVALLLTVPLYAVAIFGSLIRSLVSDQRVAGNS